MNRSVVRRRRSAIAFSLLALAATSRLLLQIAAMPPYAGLDELYHVARLSFVAEEGHNPSNQQPSIPQYLQHTLDDDPAGLPDFGTLGVRWPDRVRSGRTVLNDVPVTTANMQPYSAPNYEAQQPDLYYLIAAPLVRALPRRTAISELQIWRLLSVLLAIMTVLCSGLIGYRFFGVSGVLAAALLVSFPTWLTLVVRSSNDALCCAAIALGAAVTLSKPRSPAGIFLEALAWSAGVATKLYSWPILVLLPLAWWNYRASRARMAFVSACISVSVLLTIGDLAGRTSNALGLFAFDPVATSNPAAVTINFVQMAKIWTATAIWTSGQHWNALTGRAMITYALPVMALILFGVAALWRRQRILAVIAAAVVVAFALAQSLNAAAFILKAHRLGLSLPAGGKEGWYWYALAPVLILIPAAAFRELRGRPLLLIFFCIWITGWDVIIAERGLFRDYAGLTSAKQHSMLFRWGPTPQDRALPPTAIGPFRGERVTLRIVHLACVALLIALTLRVRETELASAGDQSSPAS
ncbi:MAG: hypothetical protein ABI718_01410 [Acidobacteriota bacterium]